MWGLILKFIGAPMVSQLLSGLLDFYKARLASTDTTTLAAVDLVKAEILAEVAARHEATNLLIAEQGNWLTRSIRPLFALPFIIFECKVIVWDKVLSLGTTDHLDPLMWGVFNTIIISYFGATAIERVTKILKR